MAPFSPDAARARARIAGLSRGRDYDAPELLDARRDLRAIRLEDYVRKVLSEAPPLTDEQRSRIAGMFRAGGAAA